MKMHSNNGSWLQGYVSSKMTNLFLTYVVSICQLLQVSFIVFVRILDGDRAAWILVEDGVVRWHLRQTSPSAIAGALVNS